MYRTIYMICYVHLVSWGLGYVPPEHKPWNKEATDGNKMSIYTVLIEYTCCNMLHVFAHIRHINTYKKCIYIYSYLIIYIHILYTIYINNIQIVNTIAIPSMKKRDRLCQLCIRYRFLLAVFSRKPHLISFGLGMAGSVSGFLQSKDKGIQHAHHVQVQAQVLQEDCHPLLTE